MRLAQKVGKLTNGKALTSAGRHLFPRHRGLRLDPATLMNSIDKEAFKSIQRKNPRDFSTSGWPKYLDLPKWMDKNVRRIRALGLDAGSRKSILDLGCGAGYFLFIAKYLGHDVLGLDIDEVPMFREMAGLFGIKRVIWRVRPFVGLPQLHKQFDLITAFMICFNGHKTPGLWGVEEWKFFLEDLSKHLKPRGRVCLSFNREDDGRHYNDELERFFAERGAEVEGQRVILSRQACLMPA
jgi:SAM-dependent methyltransferase